MGDIRWLLGNTSGCFIASNDPLDFANKIELALDFAFKFGKTKGRDRILELSLDSESVARKLISLYLKNTKKVLYIYALHGEGGRPRRLELVGGQALDGTQTILFTR